MAYLEFVINKSGCFVVPTNGPIISEKGRINYPVMRISGRPVKTRKLVYEECFGLIPPGFVIKNTCPNPRCINPEHLTLISRSQLAEEARKHIDQGYDPEKEKDHLNTEEIRLAKVLLNKLTKQETAEVMGVSEEVLEAYLTMPF